ncbi:MAG: peptide chain release factor 2 [Erysipelothrix sp.]|nr:peptide chain release factor 2 [Erysipelothrix sp.]
MEDLSQEMLHETFWNDSQKAQTTIKTMNRLKNLVEESQSLESKFEEFSQILDELRHNSDPELFEMIQQDILNELINFDTYEIKVLLSGEYDVNSAIVEIHPGAGGTESQDWAQMLYRMYTRWANRHDYKVEVIDYLPGDAAGIKSVTFSITGDYVFGYLKGEKGVHRLVRISPFDSSGRRHTSFASVDIMPVIENDTDLELDINELEIDTHRSSGAGGQHVNKTDSAVRITHLPTGISVHVQSERSQLQNKAQAMELIKSKLLQLQIQEQAQKISDIKGEQKNIEWGSQIRSYVFMPYTLVKDNRTSVEVGNIESVMDGNIDPFIQGYLKQNLK